VLQTRQLEPATRELLRQAATTVRAGEVVSPVIFLHAPGTWVMLGLNLRTEEEARGCLREGVAAVDLHTVDAFMLLVPLADAHRLAPALDVSAAPSAEPNGTVAVVAASRAGDSVLATADPAAGWSFEPASDAGLEALRAGLAATLLRAG
jgi:hypothetical protein